MIPVPQNATDTFENPVLYISPKRKKKKKKTFPFNNTLNIESENTEFMGNEDRKGRGKLKSFSYKCH